MMDRYWHQIEGNLCDLEERLTSIRESTKTTNGDYGMTENSRTATFETRRDTETKKAVKKAARQAIKLIQDIVKNKKNAIDSVKIEISADAVELAPTSSDDQSIPGGDKTILIEIKTVPKMQE